MLLSMVMLTAMTLTGMLLLRSSMDVVKGSKQGSREVLFIPSAHSFASLFKQELSDNFETLKDDATYKDCVTNSEEFLKSLQNPQGVCPNAPFHLTHLVTGSNSSDIVFGDFAQTSFLPKQSLNNLKMSFKVTDFNVKANHITGDLEVEVGTAQNAASKKIQMIVNLERTISSPWNLSSNHLCRSVPGSVCSDDVAASPSPPPAGPPTPPPGPGGPNPPEFCPSSICSPTLIQCLNEGAKNAPVTSITNAAQLKTITAKKHYRLENDITIDGNWSTRVALDKSVLDGNGHTITLNMDNQGRGHMDGIFSGVYCSYLKDLTVKTVKPRYFTFGHGVEHSTFNHLSIEGTFNIGGIAKSIKNSMVNDLSIDIKYISGDHYSYRFTVGGIFAFPPGGIASTAEKCKITNVNYKVNHPQPIAGEACSDCGGLVATAIDTIFENIHGKGNGIQGGIARAMDGGSIKNCTFEGSLGDPRLGRVGGLIGFIGAKNDVKISQCRTRGDITSSNNSGGLIGYVTKQANHNPQILIEDSFSEMSNTSKLRNTYPQGALIGSVSVGTSLMLNRTYATGKQLPANNPCGLIGDSVPSGNTNGMNVQASFWDKDSTLCATSRLGGSAKSTTEMKDQVTYAGWDFTNIWEMPSSGGYPQLRGLP